MDPSIIGGANSISKAKKKKNPPIISSAADVLYQEIRTLIGEAVANRARSRRHIPTEEEIDVFVFASGGVPFFLLNPLVLFNSHLQGSGIALSAEDKGPCTIVIPFAHMGEQCGLKS